MPTKKINVLPSLIGLTALVLSASAAADTAWTWSLTDGGSGSFDGCVADCSGNTPTKTFRATVGGGPQVTAAAWAATASSNTRLQQAGLNFYDPNGIGLHNSEETWSSPQHAIDNDGRLELVVFDFGAGNSVSLTDITMGWVSGDADINLLAFEGGGVGDTPNVDNVLFSTSGEDLTDNGWTLVGNYDVDFGGAPGTSTISTAIESRYWIVAAYNSVYGSSCLSGGSCDTGNDYFKFKSIGGKLVDPREPPNEVPAPAPLLLTALGMLWFSRRQKRIAA